ncbi:hypothetical protein BJY52DRAFT_1398932 [Lactarius psammicola]|nr:hypothetical protein BJY52DRAFT_1398932 [Lactarius psammicola]
MMRQLFCVIMSLLPTTAFVLPSVPSRSSNGPLQATFESLTHGSDWEWNLPPNPNSTHHLIFQQRKRFATTMAQHPPQKCLVPATIPKGTILYHGRTDPEIPISHEWLAFDIEHSYLFCRQSCHMITLQAKRDLRLVYFDGLSAAKMKDGPLDSQDVVLWGRPQPDKYFSEIERIEALCDWGKPFGLDGFVRMDFISRS